MPDLLPALLPVFVVVIFFRRQIIVPAVAGTELLAECLDRAIPADIP
jgi:hypothetical protein